MTENHPEPVIVRHVRCPYCKCTRTRTYSTHGRVQYRRCQSPFCERSFKAILEPHEEPADKKTEGTVDTPADGADTENLGARRASETSSSEPGGTP